VKPVPLALLALTAYLALTTGGGISLYAQSRVTLNHQQVFLNGSNIAWVNFSADLGPTPLDTLSFRTVFDSIHAHGGNTLRFWLHTTGANTPQFASDGRVIGPGASAITDLKTILDMAWQRRIGLLLSLWSFDMLDSSHNGPLTINRSLLMLTDTSYADSYINNALIPMVSAVRAHPAIIGWEVFNEPEGMSNEFGYGFTVHVPMLDIQIFTNLVAGAIHRTDTTARVTTGAWALTSETDVNGLAKAADVEERLASMTDAERSHIESEFFARYGHVEPADKIIARFTGAANMNYYRDDRLVAAGGDALGTLDFYTVHYYDWQSTPISPFLHPYSSWQLLKPLVIAEFFPEQTLTLPFTVLYDTLFANGYAGALSWGWYSGAAGHSQPTLQANTLVLTQELFSRYPEDIDPDPVSGKVYSFTATPGLIDSGMSSVLDWKTALGTSVTLNGLSEPIRGTTVVSPGATTPYTLIAHGTITDTVALSVSVYQSGSIISFTASATRIGIGDPVVLRWATAHGSVVSLNDSLVKRIDSALVHPLASSTYRLTTIGAVRDTASILITAIPQDQLNRALGTLMTVSTRSTNPLWSNPENMVDGDTTTQWVSGTSDRQWLQCTLGQNYTIKRIVVHWGANYATAYRVQLSTDNINWATVRSITAGTGGTSLVDSINQDGGYVVILLDSRASTASGFAIEEFEVYGIPHTLSADAPGAGVPERFALMQNYPNPFNPSTTIRFALPVQSAVTIRIYNLLGQRVAEIARGDYEAGYHSIIWNAPVASGTYFCRMEATPAGANMPTFQQVVKLMVLR